ncbi:MAG: hypothetical protein ACOH1V_07865 [Stenotrophomonas sp.]
MEGISHVSQSKAGRWVWLLFFLALSIYFFASFATEHTAYYGLSVFGFLCMGLHAYKYPISFSKPLRPQIKGAHQTARKFELLGIIGVVLAITGAAWRWYAP